MNLQLKLLEAFVQGRRVKDVLPDEDRAAVKRMVKALVLLGYLDFAKDKQGKPAYRTNSMIYFTTRTGLEYFEQQAGRKARYWS
jgi:hypothetical protein